MYIFLDFVENFIIPGLKHFAHVVDMEAAMPINHRTALLKKLKSKKALAPQLTCHLDHKF